MWLTSADPVHISPMGVYIRSDVKGSETAANPTPNVCFLTGLANDSGSEESVDLRSAVRGPDGKLVSTFEMQVTIPAHAEQEFGEFTSIVEAALWSVEHPNLYTLHTTILRGGHEIDSISTSFGIRTIRFDAENGFFLNGKPVKLKGTCNHQDFAGVGIDACRIACSTGELKS